MNAERNIIVALVLSTLSALALAAVYLAGGQAQLEGLFLGLSLAGLGASVVMWSKHLFPEEEVTDSRPNLTSTDDDRAAFVESFARGEERFTRRRFLSRMLAVASGAFGVALLFPLASLGPKPGRTLFRTSWARGKRLVAGDRPVRAGDLQVGSVLTVFPEGSHHPEDSATLLIKVEPELLELPPERRGWAPEGCVAYSKICTHVGCPVGLYQQTSHELLCPCHQSTFNVLKGADPVFGPATRPLPQLPLGVDDEGFLIAQSDFTEPVGPAFWNRERQ